MTDRTKARFFDTIAERWDRGQDLALLAARLGDGLTELGVAADETVLDLGCGTGNLTSALLARMSARGRVVAVDFSRAMLAAARRKVGDDPRVRWCCADAAALPLPTASLDRAICFSAWPHFDDPHAVSLELARVLRRGGRLHVWHEAPRRRINEIHAAAGAEVCHDLLGPASETSQVLEHCGLVATSSVDDDTRYLVNAVRGAGTRS